MAHPQVRERLFALLRTNDRGEGYRESIYVDILGLPTVGVGMMLANSEYVRRFDWFTSAGHQPVSDTQVISAWNAFAPREGVPSTRGAEAAAGGHGGRTVIPEFVTDSASITRVFNSIVDTCERNAIRAYGIEWWNIIPADAQFGVLLHLYGPGQNLLQGSGWPRYRWGLKHRDWDLVVDECVWNGMRRCRREDLQLAYRNAWFVESARLSGNPVDHRVLLFPNQATFMVRQRWTNAAPEGSEPPGRRPSRARASHG